MDGQRWPDWLASALSRLNALLLFSLGSPQRFSSPRPTSNYFWAYSKDPICNSNDKRRYFVRSFQKYENTFRVRCTWRRGSFRTTHQLKTNFYVFPISTEKISEKIIFKKINAIWKAAVFWTPCILLLPENYEYQLKNAINIYRTSFLMGGYDFTM